jgi:hypothetical protein
VTTGPAWIRCETCEDFLCRIHGGSHVHDCPCPPIDLWEVDPYSDGGPPMPRLAAPSPAPPDQGPRAA